jgi:hypothetical protein
VKDEKISKFDRVRVVRAILSLYIGCQCGVCKKSFDTIENLHDAVSVKVGNVYQVVHELCWELRDQ